MTPQTTGEPSQVRFDWLESYTPASLPYMIGFTLFVPLIIGANIGAEFWLREAGYWAPIVVQGLLNAGTMSTWGIPLTIILTEWVTRMLARHFVAKREKAANERYTELMQRLEAVDRLEAMQQEINARQKDIQGAEQRITVGLQQLDERQRGLEESTRRQQAWYEDALARWEEAKASAEAEGRDFTLPPPPPPDMNGSKEE